MPHKISHIELDEISLVDLPANKKKFLFKKAADKDKGGFLICDCGHKEALIDFLKSASEECPNCSENLMDSATKIMFKGKKIMKKLSEILIDFIGEDELEDAEIEKFEKADKKLAADVSKAIKGALQTLSKFEDFPDDVKESIDTLAKYAAFGYPAPTKKKEDEIDDEDDEEEKDLKKAGAKLSKATMELIKSVVEKGKPLEKAIKALAALVQKDAQKSAELLVIEAKMEELTEKLDKALAKKKKKTKKEKKEEDEVDDEDEKDEEDEDEDEEDEDTKEAEKELKKLKKRIKNLEEKKGTKKSLKGQEDDEEVDDEDEDDGEKKKTKKNKPWSFSLAKTETEE